LRKTPATQSDPDARGQSGTHEAQYYVAEPAYVAPSSTALDRPIRVVAMMEAVSVTGPAKNVIEFATRLAARNAGHVRLELSVIAFVRGDERHNAFVAAARAAGVVVDVIQERFAFDIGVIPQLRKIVKARQPDIIQTHAVKSHFLVWLTRLHRRYRWVAFNRGYTWENLKVRAYNQLDRFSLSKADQVITVCEAFARDLQRIGIRRDRVVVQHNMVLPFAPCLPDETAELRKRWRIASDAIVLLSVGRLSPEKGHADLIDAINHLCKWRTGRNFHLLIVGEGPEQNAIQQKIDRLGLGDLVTLTGQQHNMRPYYSMADIVVLPSHSEGSPNVLLEAMAARLPTVATNVGGIPEIAKHGQTTLIVEKRKPQAIAEALLRLIKDEPLRRQLGQAGALCVAQYDPEHYCDFMIEIHRRLVRKGR
jgi:glycosyltransferase involved in cell wall biosynthesis